jgi:hypothetical protein
VLVADDGVLEGWIMLDDRQRQIIARMHAAVDRLAEVWASYDERGNFDSYDVDLDMAELQLSNVMSPWCRCEC